jgi:hypothetical protein
MFNIFLYSHEGAKTPPTQLSQAESFRKRPMGKDKSKERDKGKVMWLFRSKSRKRSAIVQRKVRDPLTKRFARNTKSLEEMATEKEEAPAPTKKSLLFLENKYVSDSYNDRKEKKNGAKNTFKGDSSSTVEDEKNEDDFLMRRVHEHPDSESDIDFDHDKSVFSIMLPEPGLNGTQDQAPQAERRGFTGASASAGATADEIAHRATQSNLELLPLLRKLASSSIAMKRQLLRKTRKLKSDQAVTRRELMQLKQDFALLIQPINARLDSENALMRQEHC